MCVDGGEHALDVQIDAISVDDQLHNVGFLARRSFYLLVLRFQSTLRLNTARFRPLICNMKPRAIAAEESINSILIIPLAMITSNYPSIVNRCPRNPLGFAALNTHLQLVMHHIPGLYHYFRFGLRDGDGSLSGCWREGQFVFAVVEAEVDF